MADTWALTKLFDDVVARFALDSLAVPNLFGWREPGKKITTGKRIVWYPGDPQGAFGDSLAAKYPGRNPRPLATVRELFTVEITSEDLADAEDERAQYLAVRELYDAWYRAVHLAASGTFGLSTSSWVIDKKERRHGACLRVVAWVEAMVPDVCITSAPVDTVAEIEVEELDINETLSVAP